MSITTFTKDEFEALEAKHTMPRMLCSPGGTIGLGILAIYPFETHPVVVVLATLFTAYFFFCWTSCFHETAHQTLTSVSWVNVWVGRLIGVGTWIPYTVYRESHIRHHAYLNKPNDWELWPYSDPKCSLTFRRVFVWIDLIFGIVSPALTYGRIYFHPQSPLSRDARRTIRREYLGIAATWGVVIAAVSYWGVWLDFLRVWIIPVAIAGVFQTIRKFTEHLGLASYDPLLGARTVIGPNWFTRFSTYANFDIFVHGPHHRHPRIAHDQLRDKMWDYMRRYPDVAYPVYKTYTAATLSMLPYVFKNPGVGMNVGAAVPVPLRDADVEDFVSDAAAELLDPRERDRIGELTR